MHHRQGLYNNSSSSSNLTYQGINNYFNKRLNDTNNNYSIKCKTYNHEESYSPYKPQTIYNLRYQNYDRYKTLQKEANNKSIFTNYDIKKIVDVIEGIKKNQEDIIDIIKDLKSKTETMENNEMNNNNSEKNNSNKESILNSEVLTSINKLREDYESMKKELLMLKNKDEENKKIIEINKNEIQNMKNEYKKEENSKNDILNEKDKKIKELEESLGKNEKENLSLKTQLIESKNEINLKDREIMNLQNEIKKIKSKSINVGMEPNEFFNMLNTLNDNVNSIRQSMFQPIQRNNTTSNNLINSVSTTLQPERNIIYKNGSYKLETNEQI